MKAHPAECGRVKLCKHLAQARLCVEDIRTNENFTSGPGELNMIYVMTVLHICAVLACILWLAHYFNVSLVETLPVFVCVLVIVLYVLAMVHHLSWIDGIAVAVLVLFGVRLIVRPQEERKVFFRGCLDKMTHASFITALFLLAAIAVCTSGKVVSWWDDINFWATDVKALYFLDGFAGKYANVAPEFGDYPPGAQLIKWWFLHLDSHVFREGLAFVGYYMMNMAFMLPLLRKLKGRNIPVMILMAGALWFLPSIAEVYGYDGFCADLTMACIYGGFLLAVTDLKNLRGMEDCSGSLDSPSLRSESRNRACSNFYVIGNSYIHTRVREADLAIERSSIFYYGRCALYLGVLVLIKSIGFVWALFGLIFMFLYLRCDNHAKERNAGGTKTGNGAYAWKFGGFLVTVAFPVLTGGSWMLFCLLMRRVTKTTATAVKYMTTDEYGISGYTKEFAEAFRQAFVSSPLHKDKTVAIDLTPLSLYLCICLLVVVFCGIGNRFGLLMPRERKGKMILWFTVISGAVFYAVIFIAHITIFATETQYLEASGMISSIERYGAPFTVGTLIFLAGIWLEGAEHLFDKPKFPGFIRRYGTYLCLILFVALTAGYQVGYYGLVGYRKDVQTKLAERVGMIGEDERQFLDRVIVLRADNGTRVCYIRRGDTPRWVNNSYAGYEASPTSVVYRSVNLDDAPTDWMVQEIRASHAAYLYVEKTDADVGAVFDEITQGSAFSCGVLYHIADDGTDMKLTQVSQ